ncbi:hypothetical protein OP10G_4711 [Fimbriimonas ginsengisoli Gsoil 348]|uniref:Uncharacterized protein n=1 Tax=Fimbriimonas ginsengisoli Gsoil 348 TaxID=661478 RepID=A0A068NZ74_FIMGI|nr:hypothetical protein OP10G_4711 [Fimbriimonas ginsengisoli Gsoil 348]
MAMTTPFGYSAIPSVRNDGSMFGYELVTDSPKPYVPSFWMRPDLVETIPILDDRTVYESVIGLSPNQDLVIGSSLDVHNSFGPRRGFVYRRSTGAFHVLRLAGTSSLQVYPLTVSDSGAVTGTVYDPDGVDRYERRFTYNLSDDSYQVLGPTPDTRFDPGYPAEATSRMVDSVSSNRAYATGRLTLVGHARFVIWSLLTHEYRLIGPVDVNGVGGAISDDGTVSTFQNSVSPYQTWLCKEDGQLHDLLTTIRASGYGSAWGRIGFVSLSPNGKYLTATGVNGNYFNSAVRLQIK